jgi:hypothetical protein
MRSHTRDLQDFKDKLHARLLANSRVEGDCWNWTGAVHPRSGQAIMKVLDRAVTAARVAFWVYCGDSQNFDLFDHCRRVVRIGCSNPKCVNFEHLAAIERRKIAIAVAGKGGGSVNRQQRRTRHVIQMRPDGPLRKWLESARRTRSIARRNDLGIPPAAGPLKPLPKSA